METIRMIIFLIVTHGFGTCDGQEKPRYSFPNFSNESVGHDFCAQHRFVEDGKMERRDALRGMDLSIALLPYQLNAKTGAIDEDHPDAAVLFLDELARRAGFQWRNSYGVIETPKKILNETYTDVIVWGGQAYDVVGEYFYRSKERIEKGILFSEGWVDADSILVKTVDVNKDSASFFNFLAPFTYGLWALIGCTVVLTGFIYYLIDYLDSLAEQRKLDLGFRASMFNAAWLFTGHTLHEPKSAATRLVVFASSFLCLLTVAAYTANMVSFLLPQPDKIIIKGMNDVIRYDLTCCIDSADFTTEFMKKKHPMVRLVEIEDPSYGDKTYHSLAKSHCDVLITDEYMFKKRQGSSEYNPNCNLTNVGSFFDSEGYFPIKDSPDRCTSLVSEVLTLHLLEMKRDETYDTIWENFFSKSATVFCEGEKKQNEGVQRISVTNMFGIFVLYVAALFGAVLWSFFHFYHGQHSPVATQFFSDLRKSFYGRSSLARRLSAISNLESTRRLSISDLESTRRDSMAENPSGMQHVNFGQENLSSNDSRTEQKEDLSLQLQKFWVKLEERNNESMKYIVNAMNNNIERFEENAKSLNNDNIQRFEENVKSMNNNIQRFEENVKSMNDNIQKFEENVNKQLQELQMRVNEIEKKQQ